ncbi:MlaD family protein [Halothiobacillus sp. DCM-1]|uniref:MlaD family protein n=1 Tax=Halothiobacillus sp. DCM-1 TaxID=3112558 RepID=UPI00324EBBD4
MESKINYTAVGAFVMLLGLGFAVLLYWLVTGGKQQQFTPYVIYATDSVAGLTENSSVLYRGVSVGHVTQIGIDPHNPGRIKILVALDASLPIRADTVAQLRPQGVTGLSVLNLTGGKSAQPLDRRNSDGDLVIPYEPSIFSRLEGGLSDTMVKITRVTDRVDQLMSEHNIQTIGAILDNVHTVTQTLADHQADIGEFIAAARQTAQHTARLTQSTITLVQQLEGLTDRFSRSIVGLKEALSATKTAANQVSDASQSTIRLTTTGTTMVQRLDQRVLPELSGLIDQLQQASLATTRLLNQLSDNPSRILYGAAPLPPGPGEAGHANASSSSRNSP